ncbi:MAG: transcriptional repressor LexA [Candidatus Binatia bacterium]
MLPELTPRQKRIYDFLSTKIREKGYAPSIPEIGQRFKITSTRGVFDHLKALEKKGYIRRIGKRAIEILSPKGRSAFPEATEIPIVGRIRAGAPLLAEENVEGFLTVANEVARGKGTFALKVKGDSMVEDGILDGDYVVIRRQETAENGDIVCALIGEEATLKRFYRQGETVALRPANKNYDPIVVTRGEFCVLGKAIGVIRKL